jgi:hypothetical protein
MEDRIALERAHFPVRFEDDPPGANEINTGLVEAEIALRRQCEPYTNQNPYRFLQRFIYTLKPTLLIEYMRSRPSNPRK